MRPVFTSSRCPARITVVAGAGVCWPKQQREQTSSTTDRKMDLFMVEARIIAGVLPTLCSYAGVMPRAGFINPRGGEFWKPQRLKPAFLKGFKGTAEAVPFQSLFMKPALALSNVPCAISEQPGTFSLPNCAKTETNYWTDAILFHH